MAKTRMDEYHGDTKRKRQEDTQRRKFLFGDKVEARSVDEGFSGSWHSARVIACGRLYCQVEYDNLLEDEGTGNLLKETIKFTDYYYDEVNYRGLIRPIPNEIKVIRRFSLNYGLCVDALVDDAWREGVVFDYEDGNSERLVFFPDLGDAVMMKIHELRVTQDWDEIGDTWKIRGNWKFLELIEEYEVDIPAIVSVRQIWYDLRQLDGFRNKIKEWTCGEKSVWADLVRECIFKSLHMTAEYVVGVLQSKMNKDARMSYLLEDGQGVVSEENPFAISLYDDDPVVKNLSEEEDEEYCPSPSRTKRRKISHSTHVVSDYLVVKESKPVLREEWLTAGKDFLPEAKFCPEALETYLKCYQKDASAGKRDLVLDCRMHLSYLGWKIEYRRHATSGTFIFRYRPLKGAPFYSLRLACQAVISLNSHPVPLCRKDQGCASPPYVDVPPYVDSESLICSNRPSESHGTPIIHGKLDVIPESWPEPLRNYVIACRKEKHTKNIKQLREIAKKYLFALGWTSKPIFKKDFRKDIFYVSPRKKSYNSLLTACVGHCRGEEISDSADVAKENIEASHIQENNSREQLKRQRNSASPHSSSNRKTKKVKASRLQLDSECKTHVQHSSKRARQDVIPTSAHRSPRTVLSWLIESNVVLPREKVRYLSLKDNYILGQGKISGNGIKCNCCQQVFGMTNFGRHVGSTCMRPSSRIFLQDGRSLLDCQKQLQEKNLTCIAKKVKGDMVDQQNDYICSICHYGGTLVLCDHCPSSFHLDCLGIKDLPDGKWFCPSCQCGICGQGELDGDSEEATEKKFLRCDQCNQEYHVGCVRKRGSDKLDSNLKRSWFCSMKCEKLFAGLNKLIGQSVPVGVDNLSWSILKPPSDKEADTELQSKLSVALSVIHECFEPIKEPGKKTDLVEDVLFNNTSKLNRLNFWGFYTVLLEREDELISVATVRIHNEKVAEVPLVGTRVHYRYQGMCRILFNVLEQKLKELEVERLILPAIPQVLQTWTTSFGFSKMTSSERSEFLKYSFLDFPDTTMCQKILRMSPVAKPTPEPTYRNTIIPEVVQAVQMEQSQVKGQQHVELGHNSEPCIIKKCFLEGSNGKQQDYPCSQGTTIPDEKSVLVVYHENQQKKWGACVKFYTRKKRIKSLLELT
ncbi:uncharacterized protein LOC113325227 [Papaver somniferum]|uniref:uncharacterized protein LOC113325227 n=1 Tax=Papaver somniferum TaxID=3469 RepID=UPI000E6FF6BA|nr:uncharacterized protein LOC113325227 [Papaver somniferum]